MRLKYRALDLMLLLILVCGVCAASERFTVIELSDGNVNITKGGSYLLTGEMKGCVYVDAGDETVCLMLENVSIENEDGSAILIDSAKNAEVTVPSGSVVRLVSGEEEDYTEKDVKSAALLCKTDLDITGNGTLSVTGNIAGGIECRGDLKISETVIDVTAKKNGISGKRSVTVGSGTVSVTAGKDGIRSSGNKKGKGSVIIEGGSINVMSGGDGIYAASDITIDGGVIDIKAGSMTATEVSEDANGAKGVRSGGDLRINGGSITLSAGDDAFHAQGGICVFGGSMEIECLDDALHADGELEIGGGKIGVTACYEGIEGDKITVHGGSVSVTSDDDGMNAENGVLITGGDIYINAEGDGIDSNRGIQIDAGTVIIDGPSRSVNGALDSGKENGGACVISGGTALAIGHAWMAESFDESSKQCFITSWTDFEPGNVLSIKDAAGHVLFKHTAAKSGASIVFSSPDLEEGEIYTLYIGPTAVDEVTAGFNADYGIYA